MRPNVHYDDQVVFYYSNNFQVDLAFVLMTFLTELECVLNIRGLPGHRAELERSFFSPLYHYINWSFLIIISDSFGFFFSWLLVGTISIRVDKQNHISHCVLSNCIAAAEHWRSNNCKLQLFCYIMHEVHTMLTRFFFNCASVAAKPKFCGRKICSAQQPSWSVVSHGRNLVNEAKTQKWTVSGNCNAAKAQKRRHTNENGQKTILLSHLLGVV